MSLKPNRSGARGAAAPPRRQRIGRLIAVVVFCIGVCTSVVVGRLVYSGQRTAQRQAFATAATTLTADLSQLVGRDQDFVTTMRTVLDMNPRLTATQFSAWYDRLGNGRPQTRGMGITVIRVVPAAQVAAFQARRDADLAFLKVINDKVVPIATPRGGQMCLASAGIADPPLSAYNATFLQRDWCDTSSILGLSEAPLLRDSARSGRLVVIPVNSLGLHTTLLIASFYKPGAPVSTAAQRRAALAGWLISSVDPAALVRQALSDEPNLGVRLLFTAPAAKPVEVVDVNRQVGSGRLRLYARLSEPGWTAEITGVPRGRGLSPLAQELIVAIGGAVLSLLLALLILTFSRSRQRALELVDEKTGQLRHQALHDALTELPNRVLALDRAETMLARARRDGQPVAALYIDIDGFKQINDTFGHAVGDRFLILVAGRLRQVVREADTAARLSGDEFVILVEGSALDVGPQLVAERVLDVLREPYDLTDEIGRRLTVSASIGVAHGLRFTADELLAEADIALYAAKEAGRDRFIVYESGMQTAAQERVALEMDLRDALEAGQLSLVYQPTLELSSERIVGVEALLRWHHPERGSVERDEFIPIAERSGLIVAIGRWVLESACAQAARWREQGHELSVAVNVSGRQLDTDGLMDDVLRALTLAGLPPAALTLEITETALMRDPDATARRLEALKRMGVRIAIDDFGTGYSSLGYLRQFPIDTLKIDQSFVGGIDDSSESGALIRTLIQLGKTLGLETLGEGIELPAQLEQLQREQCDLGQGFLFAHPLSPEGLGELLDEHSALRA